MFLPVNSDSLDSPYQVRAVPNAQRPTIELTLRSEGVNARIYLNRAQANQLIDQLVWCTYDHLALEFADELDDERVGILAEADEHGTPYAEPRVASQFDTDE